MRIIAAAAVFSSLLIVPDSTSASGAYRCCLIDKAGYRYVYQGRASGRYKGTINGLCANASREQQARPCDAGSAIQIGFDFVKGRQDFGPDDQPDQVNLFTHCSDGKCAIGLTVKGASKLSVSARNKARCLLKSFPGPKDPPATAAYTLDVTLTVGQANACQLDIDGKSTTFFSDIKAAD